MQVRKTVYILLPLRDTIHVKTKLGGYNMDIIALIISIIGCLNWGLIGLFQFDLVAWLFGGQSALLSRVVYTLVGLAGLWDITLLFRRLPKVDGE